MKIIALQAENIKKLKAIEIRPDGNMVQITGRNGQGKTSILDSIWWALSGKANIQGNPIRNGENQAKIRLDLGEIRVTRTFRKDDKDRTTTSIVVEDSEGTAIRQPQAILSKLIGELSFDPLEFSRMTKTEQFEQLRRFVPDVDFEAFEKAHQEDYDVRTNINRQAMEAKVLAKDIFVSLPPDTERVDESGLLNEMLAAGQNNADIELRKGNRGKMQMEIDTKHKEAMRLITEADEIESRARGMRLDSLKLCKDAEVLDGKLESAKPLPEPIDVFPLKKQLEEAKEINKQLDKVDQRATLLLKAEGHDAEADAITAQMNTRIREKQEKIATAKLPVEGLGFGDGEILMNGVQFNQASDSEQLSASIAVAMALNPELRVIRVRDGSLMDEDSMAMLARMADDKDYQVWIERVDSSGAVGFVIEDGHVMEVPA